MVVDSMQESTHAPLCGFLCLQGIYTEQAHQVEVRQQTTLIATHAHRLMMGWATQRGPRPCQFVALERSRFRKSTLLIFKLG